MNKVDVLADVELPHGFSYPRQFSRIVELGILDLEPWYLLQGNALRNTMSGLAERYPQHRIVPFARRQDNDDVACWQVGSSEEVHILHDFATGGWEQRMTFPTFYDWLRQAIEDLIEFDN